jgi:hydrogenase maturation factor
MIDPLPMGKLPIFLLEKLLGNIAGKRSERSGRTGIGVDAAVAASGMRPSAQDRSITFTSENIAWYVVTINANDIACMGGTPGTCS